MDNVNLLVADNLKSIRISKGWSQSFVEGYRADIQTYTAHKPVDKDAFSMKIGNRTYTDKKEAGAALIDMCRSAKHGGHNRGISGI